MRLLIVLAFLCSVTTAQAQTYLMIDPEEVAYWDGYSDTGGQWVYSRQPILLGEDNGDYVGAFYMDATEIHRIEVRVSYNNNYGNWNLTFSQSGDTLFGVLQYEDPPAGLAQPIPTQYLDTINTPGATGGSYQWCEWYDDNAPFSPGTGWGPGEWKLGIKCAKFRMVDYGGGGGGVTNVSVDLGDVEEAYDASQDTQGAFVQDELSTEALAELTPPEFNKFAPGDSQLPINFTLPSLDGEGGVDVSIDLTDASVLIGEDEISMTTPEQFDALRTSVRTIFFILLTIGFFIAHIRQVRSVIGG